MSEANKLHLGRAGFRGGGGGVRKNHTHLRLNGRLYTHWSESCKPEVRTFVRFEGREGF